MEFSLLKASRHDDRRVWEDALAHLPAERRDVYFQPGYLLAYEAEGHGEAWCAVAGDGDARWLYPFLKSPTDPLGAPIGGQSLFDIQTAYGYGGPVVNGAGENGNFLETAWQTFHHWCAGEGVVGEFCRFHPLIDNHRWASGDMAIIDDRETVVMEAREYVDAVWNSSYYRVHRNMIRRAEREGYSFRAIETGDHMSWFEPMYAATQDKLKAQAETRFSRKYFDTLVAELGENSWLAVVEKERTILCAAIVLQGERFAHSHLMGYRDLGSFAGITNLLYHGAACEAAELGLSELHMGGGGSGDPKDPLFRFKATLGPGRGMFRIGTRCHNQGLYDTLGERWTARFGPRPGGYFLYYRLDGADRDAGQPVKAAAK